MAAVPQIPPLSFEKVYEQRDKENPRLVSNEELAKYRLSAELRSVGQADARDSGETAGWSDGQADARPKADAMHALPFCSTTNFVKGI